MGKGERPRAALQTDAVCDFQLALDRLRLFPGRDTVQLRCRTGGGNTWQERILLVDFLRDAPATLYDLYTGDRAGPTPEERKSGDCGTYPVGELRVEKTAPRPLLRVVDPAWGELHNSRGTLPARQLGYDADRQAFVPTGAPDIPKVVDGRSCRRGG